MCTAKIIVKIRCIKKVVITTNGYHLDQKAKMLVDSGLNGINISIVAARGDGLGLSGVLRRAGVVGRVRAHVQQLRRESHAEVVH